MSCDSCGITVHQSCYGISELPDLDEMWMCRVCELKEEGEKAPQCCLCPIAGGALKPTVLPNTWAHVACMMWIPEITVTDFERMEPITGVDLPSLKDRWELPCCCCRQRMGTKVQCSLCYTSFHPLCGRMAGFNMDMNEKVDLSLEFIARCPKHVKPCPEKAGLQLYRESKGPAKDGSLNSLWNAQPFKPPPAVPLPLPKGGCARATSVRP